MPFASAEEVASIPVAYCSHLGYDVKINEENKEKIKSQQIENEKITNEKSDKINSDEKIQMEIVKKNLSEVPELISENNENS